MDAIVAPILDALRLTWSQLQLLSPRLISATLLLTAGWLVARLVRHVLIRLLRLARLETAAERTGVEGFLMRGGVPFTAVTLVGAVAYWLVMLVGVLAMFNALGMTASGTLLEQISGYLPKILVAMVILVFGSTLARFLGGTVETYLNNIGAPRADLTGLIARGALLAFVALLALRQLQVGADLLVPAFELAFGGLCLALALAFGLGGRDWAAGILQRAREPR